jgi:hypothetical protein
MILACLLTTLSMPAYAGAFGPPAELTVKQMPQVAAPQVQAEDDILTPLPGEDSALPRVEKPQPSPSKLLGLTPSDLVTPVYGMPPQPAPIRDEEKRTAANYGPAVPAQPAAEKVSFMPGTAIPFPPSADEWSARMPLTAKAALHEPAKAVQTAAAGNEDELPALHRPSQHSATHTAATADDDDFDRPRHIVVHATADAGGQCRSYTRNLGDGRKAEGTACRGGDGIWRIEDEHLVTRMRVARIYHVNSAPYDSGPSPYRQATGIAHLGLTLGSFWHFR